MKVLEFHLIAPIGYCIFVLESREVITASMYFRRRWIDKEPSAAAKIPFVKCAVVPVAKAADEEGWYGVWRCDSGDTQADGDALGVSVGKGEEGLKVGLVLGWCCLLSSMVRIEVKLIIGHIVHLKSSGREVGSNAAKQFLIDIPRFNLVMV